MDGVSNNGPDFVARTPPNDDEGKPVPAASQLPSPPAQASSQLGDLQQAQPPGARTAATRFGASRTDSPPDRLDVSGNADIANTPAREAQQRDLRFPLRGMSESVTFIVEGQLVKVDANGLITAGGELVVTLEGRHLEMVDGVPTAGGKIVTVNIVGEVFVGGRPSIDKTQRYKGGQPTTLTTLPKLMEIVRSSGLTFSVSRPVERVSDVHAVDTIETLFDVVARDAQGDPIFESTGLTTVTTAPKPEQGWQATMEPGRLRMSDGTSVIAYKNLSTLPEYDCSSHGYSIADGKFFIENSEMGAWLGTTELLVKTSDPRVGDLVVYRNADGNIEQSGVLTRPGMVTMALGTRMLDNDARATPLGGIVGVSKATMVTVDEGAAMSSASSVEYWQPAHR